MYRSEKLNAQHQDFYALLEHELVHLVEHEEEWLSALSNAAALLRHHLEDINWVGFYLYKNGALVLGPFQGLPACTSIPLGQGVCGTAAERRETILVPDVHLFPGHIACDDASLSEVVVPIFWRDTLMGVLDVDSPIRNRFSERDRLGLESFVSRLSELVPWEAFRL